MTATERLIAAIEVQPAGVARDSMLRRARALTYHDYKSSVALPKVQLVLDLERAGWKELADRARNGEFDEGKEEADEWMASLPENERAEYLAALGVGAGRQ